MDEAPANVTELLRAWGGGDAGALPELMERVYVDLRKIARNQFRRERADHTLQPTALVNELYVRLQRHGPMEWRDRRHFYSIASRLMRRLLVDHAREHGARKRKAIKVTLRDDAAAGGLLDLDLLTLESALAKLEARYPRECRVVELRYLCGLSNDEVAEAVGTSLATVKRDWTFARSWLLRELRRGESRGPAA